MDQNQIPLLKKLMDHKIKKTIPFHVPGHKNGILFNGLDDAFTAFMDFDVTELSGLDDLHEPEEVISEAQQLLTNVYQTKKSYFLVNGSTVGNLAMILACCKEGDTVLVQRNCHKSILNGLMLANVKPIFITPDISESTSLFSSIEPVHVEQAFARYPDIKACIFTYPDYYGQTYKLKAIIEIAHRQESIVLIDEAHGPHFQIGDPFPDSALKLGADIVVHSAHKMLPAMTMGSYLHINSDQIERQKVEFYLSVLQSSSPSYPIMASLDIARSYLANFSNEDITYTMEKRQTFLDKLVDIPNLYVHPLEIGQDPLKMLIAHEDLTGYALQSVFEKHHIYPEMADPYQVLFTLPLLKQNMVFPYEAAASKISKIFWGRMEEGHSRYAINNKVNKQEKMSELYFSYKAMLNKSAEVIPMGEAIGRIAAKMVIPYPPGIPLLLPGEKITTTHIERLKELLLISARFQGGGEALQAGMVEVFIH
ncbi:aminotransferase class I/II-fold pyridoxal phosphate-dependent enzyme [Bacillus sp. FSL K6-3431]|uniref:aminotransferase class I/II-fold pyridoxal phosphate-dependent enzyme n=1 Tax=Bacillus sp. FSL K6-3431 TaxID=2921500 RepID=UPI0030FC2E3F